MTIELYFAQNLNRTNWNTMLVMQVIDIKANR